MSKLQTPFRYDFVGSFLRPQALKDAKAAYQAGEISKEAFDRVAEEEVAKVVAKQKELGYHVITDGSSEELSGIWISCGALKALHMRTQATACSLTLSWHCWRTPIW